MPSRKTYRIISTDRFGRVHISEYESDSISDLLEEAFPQLSEYSLVALSDFFARSNGYKLEIYEENGVVFQNIPTRANFQARNVQP